MTLLGRAAPTPAAFVEARSGTLEVRLARSEAELDAALALRYRVFYDEMGARPDAATMAEGRDRDAFDAVADHLLVLDHALGDGPEAVVGTYRLIRRPAAARVGRFYSEDEYDIGTLTQLPGEILELGRSCVGPNHRTRGTLQLLWRGIAEYVHLHGIDLLFGCASLPGTDPEALALSLSFLHAHHLAPPALRPRALPQRYVAMDRVSLAGLDPRRLAAGLPPLIKGYLRVGAFVGDGAVVDGPFNTTDVCIVVKTDLVTAKYSRHYDRYRPDPE